MVSEVKVVTVFVDYLLKMEKFLKEMRVLFASLELEVPPQPMFLEVIPNISVNIKVLTSLEMLALVMILDMASPPKPSFG